MSPGAVFIILFLAMFAVWCLGVYRDTVRKSRKIKTDKADDSQKKDEWKDLETRIGELEESIRYAIDELEAVSEDMGKHESIPVQEDVRRYRHTVKNCINICHGVLEEEGS